LNNLNGLFNIVLHDGNTEFPDDKLLYIVTKYGTFLRKDLGTVRSCTKVDTISFLKELKPYAELKIPQIQGSIFAIGLGFLGWIYNTYQTEGGMLIYYNSKTKEYLLHAPVQEVSYGGVHWDNRSEPISKGFIRMGTIHSHADMAAFHSGIDIDDEKSFDGLHITVGNLGEEIPSLVASIVVNGTRFPIKKENIQKYLGIKVVSDKNEIVNQEIQPSVYEDYQAWASDRNGAADGRFKKFRTRYCSYMGDNEMKFIIPNMEPGNFDFPHVWKERVKRSYYNTGIIYRVVNGKLVKSGNTRRIGFVPNNNNSLWGGADFDDSGYDYGSDYGVSDYGVSDYGCNRECNSDQIDSDQIDSDLNRLPHEDCYECIYRIIAEEALAQGIIEIEKLDKKKNKDLIGTKKLDKEKNIGDCSIDLNEKDYKDYEKLHIKSDDDYIDDVYFDKEGNIIDREGNIVEQLAKKEED